MRCVNNWVKGLSPYRGPTRIFFICSFPRGLSQSATFPNGPFALYPVVVKAFAIVGQLLWIAP